MPLEVVVYTANAWGSPPWRDCFMTKSKSIVTIDPCWKGKRLASKLKSEFAVGRAKVEGILYLPVESALPSVWEDEEPPTRDDEREVVVLSISIIAKGTDLNVRIGNLGGDVVEDICLSCEATVGYIQEHMESQGYQHIKLYSDEGHIVNTFGPLKELSNLVMKTSGKSNHKEIFEAARTAAKSLVGLDEPFQIARGQVVVLRRTHMALEECDVGTFGQHAGTPGQQWLEINAEAPPESEVRKLISRLEGQPGAGFSTFQNLAISGLQDVKAHVDEAFESNSGYQDEKNDFKVSISHNELVAMIGSEQFHALLAIFGSRPDEILIRRCQAHGQCINFHLDHSFKTLQVALNSDEEYTGGRLVYATDSGLQVPVRSSGTVTLHRNDIVHGVTKLEKGIRYGLFFLEKTSKST